MIMQWAGQGAAGWIRWAILRFPGEKGQEITNTGGT